MTEQTIIAEKLEFGVIVLPNTQALLNKIAPDLEDAKTFVVDSQSMAEIALETVGRFGTVRDAMDKERLATTLPLRDGVGKINAGYNAAIDLITEAEKAMKAKLLTWNQKVARERREAEDRARADAKKRADEEVAAAKVREQEAQRLVTEAQAAAAAGDADKAADLIVQAQMTADQAQQQAAAAQVTANTPAVYTGASSVKGTSETWKARVTDKVKFLLHVAARIMAGDLSLLECIEINLTSLNQLAKAQKAGMNLPGVEAYTEAGIRARKVAV